MPFIGQNKLTAKYAVFGSFKAPYGHFIAKKQYFPTQPAKSFYGRKNRLSVDLLIFLILAYE